MDDYVDVFVVALMLGVGTDYDIFLVTRIASPLPIPSRYGIKAYGNKRIQILGKF